MWPFTRNKSGAEERSLENPSVSLSDPRAFDLIFGGGLSATGIEVTQDKALSVPAIWSAVNFLSGTIASLPLELFRRDGESRDKDTTPKLYRLLHDAPNDEWTSYRWRKYSMTQTLLGGRSYTLIVRNRGGGVNSLIPIDPSRVTVDRRQGRTIYRVSAGERPADTISYRAQDIIDIPFMTGMDGQSHIDPTDRLKNAIGLALALESYASKFFQNGGVPPLVLEGPFNSPAAAARASKDVAQAMIDAQRSQRNVLSMPTGHTLKPVGANPEQNQLVESRRFQLEEIARVYDIPPVFLQDLTHGTFSNTEQQDLHFVKHTLTQWLTCWEQELNLKLFGAQSNQRFVEFNVDGLLRGDFTSRMQGYATAIQNAIRTPDEVRAKENLPPKGDTADELHIQGATVPLGTQQPEAPEEDPADRALREYLERSFEE